MAVIGFTQASHTVFEGDQQISVEVGLLQDGRELQRTIEVFLTTEDRDASSKNSLASILVPYTMLA